MTSRLNLNNLLLLVLQLVGVICEIVEVAPDNLLLLVQGKVGVVLQRRHDRLHEPVGCGGEEGYVPGIVSRDSQRDVHVSRG